MLGGLGKLAAEGLAHRTEKATEGAGKGWAFLPARKVGAAFPGPFESCYQEAGTSLGVD